MPSGLGRTPRGPLRRAVAVADLRFGEGLAHLVDQRLGDRRRAHAHRLDGRQIVLRRSPVAQDHGDQGVVGTEVRKATRWRAAASTYPRVVNKKADDGVAVIERGLAMASRSCDRAVPRPASVADRHRAAHPLAGSPRDASATAPRFWAARSSRTYRGTSPVPLASAAIGRDLRRAGRKSRSKEIWDIVGCQRKRVSSPITSLASHRRRRSPPSRPAAFGLTGTETKPACMVPRKVSRNSARLADRMATRSPRDEPAFQETSRAIAPLRRRYRQGVAAFRAVSAVVDERQSLSGRHVSREIARPDCRTSDGHHRSRLFDELQHGIQRLLPAPPGGRRAGLTSAILFRMQGLRPVQRHDPEGEVGHVGLAAFRIRCGIAELIAQLGFGHDIEARIADDDRLAALDVPEMDLVRTCRCRAWRRKRDRA